MKIGNIIWRFRADKDDGSPYYEYGQSLLKQQEIFKSPLLITPTTNPEMVEYFKTIGLKMKYVFPSNDDGNDN